MNFHCLVEHFQSLFSPFKSKIRWQWEKKELIYDKHFFAQWKEKKSDSKKELRAMKDAKIDLNEDISLACLTLDIAEKTGSQQLKYFHIWSIHVEQTLPTPCSIDMSRRHRHEIQILLYRTSRELASQFFGWAAIKFIICPRRSWMATRQATFIFKIFSSFFFTLLFIST